LSSRGKEKFSLKKKSKSASASKRNNRHKK
jgi:hypothetical protein